MHILSAQLPVNTVLSHSQLANSLFFAEVSVHRTKSWQPHYTTLHLTTFSLSLLLLFLY